MTSTSDLDMPMKTNQPELLTYARKVIPVEMLNTLLASREVSHYGEAILDRWAVADPEKLIDHLTNKRLSFFARLMDQQRLEQKVLVDNAPLWGKGYSTLDILQMNEVNLAL